MATAYFPKQGLIDIDSPIVSRLFVKRNRVTVQNSIDLMTTLVPILLPMGPGVITVWGMMTNGLPIENYYGRLFVSIILGLTMEFCGMMYIDYITQASQYKYKKPLDAPDVNQKWGVLAVVVYLIVSLAILSIDVVLPSVFVFAGYSDNVKMLAPVPLLGLPFLTILTFIIQRDIHVINTVYDLEHEKTRVFELELENKRKKEIERRNLEASQRQSDLAYQKAQLELARQQAEIEAIKAVSEVKVLRAKAKVTTVKPLENFTETIKMSLEEGEAKYRELKLANPKLSTRKAKELLENMGCKVSHSTIGVWARKLERNL